MTGRSGKFGRLEMFGRSGMLGRSGTLGRFGRGRFPGKVVGRSFGKAGLVTGGRAIGGSTLGRLILGRLILPIPFPPIPLPPPGRVVGGNGPVGRVVGREGNVSGRSPGEGRLGPKPGRGAGLVVGRLGFTIPPPGKVPGRVDGLEGLGRAIGSGRVVCPGRVVGLGRVVGAGRVVGPGRVAGLLGLEMLPGKLLGKLGFAEGMLGRDVGSFGFEMFAPPPPDGSFGVGMEGRA